MYVIGRGGDQKRIIDVDGTSGNRDMVLFTDVNPADVQRVERQSNTCICTTEWAIELMVENYFAAERTHRSLRVRQWRRVG